MGKSTHLHMKPVKEKVHEKVAKMLKVQCGFAGCRYFDSHKLQFLISNSARRMSDAVQGKEKGREKESLIDHVGYGSLRELSKIAA